MEEEYKVLFVHDNKTCTPEEQLRNEIEMLKAENTNLVRLTTALLDELTKHGIEWKGLPDLDE